MENNLLATKLDDLTKRVQCLENEIEQLHKEMQPAQDLQAIADLVVKAINKRNAAANAVLRYGLQDAGLDL